MVASRYRQRKQRNSSRIGNVEISGEKTYKILMIQQAQSVDTEMWKHPQWKLLQVEQLRHQLTKRQCLRLQWSRQQKNQQQKVNNTATYSSTGYNKACINKVVPGKNLRKITVVNGNKKVIKGMQ